MLTEGRLCTNLAPDAAPQYGLRREPPAALREGAWFMSEITQVAAGALSPPRSFPLMLGRSIALLRPATDALFIVCLSLLAGLAYHLVVYRAPGHLLDFGKAGAVVAFIHLILQQHLSSSAPQADGSFRRQFYLWNLSFLCLLAFGFVGKISGTYSRGAALLFYATGLPLLLLWQYGWRRFVMLGLETGRLAMRHGVLLGTFAKVEEFRRAYMPWQSGLIVAETVLLPEDALDDTPEGTAALKEALGVVAEAIRASHLDDVVILVPWSATRAINICADALMTLPVTVQLAPEAILDRFSEIHLSSLGRATMLNLMRPPLSRFEVLSKHLLDLGLAAAFLLVISPLLLAIAALIKLDSPGPILFRQWRHGFNQRPFRIFKFRTMSVTEDGDHIAQATENDPRLTRVGTFLRRWNLDELPQLLNVLKGDMSLVGPRPHALAHDRDFERRIAFYARRHNIKPGITGWAQVNGFRGRTDTEEKITARVDHDLYYIDNWSLPFDLYILALTALSPKAFRNAH
jgi:Undecaprenyl-phosphate glucose phosphotransferase